MSDQRKPYVAISIHHPQTLENLDYWRQMLNDAEAPDDAEIEWVYAGVAARWEIDE